MEEETDCYTGCINILFLFLHKNMLWVLISGTHKICFCAEIRKISELFRCKSPLSGAYVLSDTGKTKLTGGTVFNTFLLNGLFYHNTLDWFIANRRGVWFCLYY